MSQTKSQPEDIPLVMELILNGEKWGRDQWSLCPSCGCLTLPTDPSCPNCKAKAYAELGL